MNVSFVRLTCISYSQYNHVSNIFRYADASCKLVDTSDTSQSVCDTAIGFYTLLRFNHLQGPIALQQFRLKSELDSANEVSCPEPYTAPSYLDLSPKQCYPPFSLDPQTSSNTASISNVFPSFSSTSCTTSNCTWYRFNYSESTRTRAHAHTRTRTHTHTHTHTHKTGTFLRCDDPVHSSYYKNGAATQTLRLLGGSQYFPRCSYNAYLPPYTTNFDFVVSQIQNTGWLDTRT